MNAAASCLALCLSVLTMAQAQSPLMASGTLQRGNGPEPSTLDAHRCPEVACGNVLRDLSEGLVTEHAHGRAIPGMAESWQVSADGRM